MVIYLARVSRAFLDLEQQIKVHLLLEEVLKLEVNQDSSTSGLACIVHLLGGEAR
jgi:hypothetical protein